MTDEKNTTSMTIRITAGRVPIDIMEKALELAQKHNLEVYLTTLQNLRLNNIPEAVADDVKEKLAALGADFKVKGKFPIPRVCVGAPHCNLGVIDTAKLSQKILDRFSWKEHTKEKIKIAISACNIGCSHTKTTDISIEAMRSGYTVYAGGKGGIAPKIGKRIKRDITEDEVLEVIDTLIDYHDQKTGKKQRMFKLLSESDFPFSEV